MHGQLILESLARIEVNGDVPARSKEIQAVYERVARNWGHDPLTTLKSIQNHLADLTMLVFSNVPNRTKGVRAASTIDTSSRWTPKSSWKRASRSRINRSPFRNGRTDETRGVDA